MVLYKTLSDIVPVSTILAQSEMNSITKHCTALEVRGKGERDALHSIGSERKGRERDALHSIGSERKGREIHCTALEVR